MMLGGGDDFRIQSKMGNDGFMRKSTALPFFKNLLFALGISNSLAIKPVNREEMGQENK